MKASEREIKLIEEAKKHTELVQECSAFFTVVTENSESLSASDPTFYRYKSMLEQKNRLVQENRTESLLSKLSVLCIILGHISGIW